MARVPVRRPAVKLDARTLREIAAGRDHLAGAEAKAYRRLGPSRREDADGVRESGYLGVEYSDVSSLNRWYAAWCLAKGRALVRATCRRGATRGAVAVVTVHFRGKGFDPEAKAAVLDLMRDAVGFAAGKAGETPIGFAADGIPADRVDALAATVAALLRTGPSAG